MISGRSEEANKALSAAVQLHDTLVKAWALWGDYLEALFTRDPTHINLGVSAITCYLHASRHQNESKSRKYLAKVGGEGCGVIVCRGGGVVFLLFSLSLCLSVSCYPFLFSSSLSVSPFHVHTFTFTWIVWLLSKEKVF